MIASNTEWLGALVFDHVIPPFLDLRVLEESASSDALFSVRRKKC